MTDDTKTDNLPALPEPRPRPPVALTDVDSWAQQMQPIVWLAERIADTEFVPRSLRSVPAVTAAILYGRELGLPPMTALTNTHVIEGKPSMSAEAMRAMVVSQGHELVFVRASGAECVMRGRRRDSEHWTELAWTIDMARAAGLLGKTNWKSYPRAMLIARCTADLCRMIFPDVILGFRSVEEMTDLGNEETDAPEAPAAASGSTTVGRKRRPTAAEKRAAAAAEPSALPPAAANAAQARQGPPLPGEEESAAPAAVPDPPSPSDGDNGAPPTTSDDSTTDTHSADEGTTEDEVGGDVDTTTGEIHDAELVDEAPSEPVEDATSGTAKPGGRKASAAQKRMLLASLGERGVDNNDREERLHIVGQIAGREIGSFDDLVSIEASRVIDTIARTRDRADLMALLDAIETGTDWTPGGDQ